MSKFGRGNLLRQSSEMELHGKLQKRNRNGIFQARYFQTLGPSLKYWTNEHEKNTSPGKSFDVREFRSVQNVGDNCICIQMTNDKFKLEIKAISNEQCNEWADFLQAKMALYSVSNLKTSIDTEAVSFSTRTFAGLLRIPVLEQDKWINDMLNDVFLSVTDSIPSDDDSDEEMDVPRRTLLACQKCFEELYLICEECEVEMSLRDPVVMSNCRDFMHRYASLFLGRITMELSWYLGKDKLTSNETSDMFIIESIKFTHSINSIKHFQFLPRSLFIGLRENLQTYDQLSKYLTRLLLERNDAWFAELNELQPRQRGHKLREFFKIVNFQVDKIHSSFYLSDNYDVDTKRKLITSTISTMIFSLANYVQSLDFSNYGEEALLEHILACQEIVKFCFALRVYPYHGKINDKSPISNFGVDPHKLTKQWVIALRDHELEVVSTTFLNSANTAAASAVKNTFVTFEDILAMFFHEKKGMGWLGGTVCQLYLERTTTWVVAFCERASATPCEFHRIAIRETIRMVVYSYIHKLCERYKNDKKFMLSDEGSQQMASDLQSIMTWIDAQNVKLIPPSIKNKSEYYGCNDLTMLVRNIRMFVTSDESSLLLCLSEAIQHFGTSSALHIYDLARLCLKIRSDVSNSERKYVLGLFSTYVEQLLKYFFLCAPLTKSHPRLSGPELLQDLFPRVGQYHCSGKKWSMEKLPESETQARLEIANLVTDACNISRIRRAGMSHEKKESVSPRKQSSFRYKRQSCGADDMSSLRAGVKVDADEDTGTSELWQLLDPSYVEPDASTLTSISDIGEDGYNDFDSDEDEDDEFVDSLKVCTGFDGKQSGENRDKDVEYDERPFVDLHGCTFEELHHSLRPKVFSQTTITPIHFVNRVVTPRKSMPSPRPSQQSLNTDAREDVEEQDDEMDELKMQENEDEQGFESEEEEEEEEEREEKKEVADGVCVGGGKGIGGSESCGGTGVNVEEGEMCVSVIEPPEPFVLTETPAHVDLCEENSGSKEYSSSDHDALSDNSTTDNGTCEYTSGEIKITNDENETCGLSTDDNTTTASEKDDTSTPITNPVSVTVCESSGGNSSVSVSSIDVDVPNKDHGKAPPKPPKPRRYSHTQEQDAPPIEDNDT